MSKMDGLLLYVAIVTLHLGLAMDMNGTEMCVKYILSSSNMTHEEMMEMSEGDTSPIVLGDGFHPDVLKDSHCAEITSCALPGTPPHIQLTNVMKTHRSLRWKVMPCSEDKLSLEPSSEDKNNKSGKNGCV